MDFLVSGILSRADDALLSLLLIGLIQFFLLFLSSLFKKSISPLPLVEMAFRPFVVFLCDKLNRYGRTEFALMIRGSIVFFLILAGISVTGILIEQALVMAGLEAHIDKILMALVLSPLGVIGPALAITRAKPKEGSYRHVAQALNQNLVVSDEFGLRRASGKVLSLALVEWVMAPILFYLIGGVPFACLYVSLSLFIRVNSSRNTSFTSIYRICYGFLNKVAAIPAIIFIFVSSIFSAGGKPFKLLSGFADAGISVECAFAYAQNITLGGTYQNRNGDKISGKWLGPEGTTAKLTVQDVIRVVIQYVITLFLITVALFCLYAFI